VIYYFCRGVLALSRSFQGITLAIFFVKLFGFGPFAGVVTLSFATIGFYGKLLAEDIEDADPSSAEAVRATGAGWLQWINYGVQPQVMPRMIGLALYRFDINFRESAVVGIVGAGGIGATLGTAFNRYEFDSAAAILLIIIAINMATVGTALALVLAMPVAYCAARNTTPSAVAVRPVALFIIVASRSINALIWALMLVTIIGPGVLAGILAIALRSIGFCAKLLYEAIEEIDPRQVEAVRATGASNAQVTAYGIVPQVMPAFAGVSVFRWDINIS